MAPPLLSTIEVADLLHQAGFEIQPGAIRVEPREERWIAHLPGDRMIWVAVSEKGREQLRIECRLLKLLETHCSFAAPRVLYESVDNKFNVRLKVPGLVDPWRLYGLLQQDTVFATRTGEAIGKILAEQHTKIERQAVAGWLSREISFPVDPVLIRGRIPQVINDAGLFSEIDAVLRQYEALQVGATDYVLVHSDLGLHNLAFDPDTLTVQGIFDYEEAAWADRHHDFRYLVFDFDRSEMLEAALAVYEPAVGVQLSRQRIYLYNAVCAFGFLAYRLGTPADEKSCGRTLAEDLRWTCWAIAQLECF
ncbi:aminoglycoside phosphotransferase family protein [Kovacikia minuta CCNUW1]|uniref:phosphotransferase family protein n=1 Tax=Kovacikia minuta TaxID=2931930 RepID=UPI001CC949D7|nr:phosphotransferase [Kovacikia minuta]UBF24005.1 aminoglycoside phosphotransferase family protein [Kovacikia minuta CCNUW1]